MFNRNEHVAIAAFSNSDTAFLSRLENKGDGNGFCFVLLKHPAESQCVCVFRRRVNELVWPKARA